MNESQKNAWRSLGLGPILEPRMPAAATVPQESESAVTVVPDPVAPSARPALDAPAAGGPVAHMSWPILRETVSGCVACALCKTRTQTVFGTGSEKARWMLVGEAPGAEEDARGEPFVGQAGRLLDSMLAALGLNRTEHVFIANVLKCRPPGNRNPAPEEVRRCEPYLKRQVALVQPALLVVMGRFAAQSMLGTDASIASLRGRLHEFRSEDGAGSSTVPMVVTYHPAYLLRNLPDKAKAWADLLLAMKTVNPRG